MARYQQQAEPKPFFWIALQKSPQRAKLTTHESHECFQALSGRMELEVQVFSAYLYVGSGTILLDNKVGAYYAFARRDKQLIIPGTGIKGAVRSIVEAISNSCVRQIARKERMNTQYQACAEVKRGQESEAQLCPACRLFGTTGYRGRIHFADALFVDQEPTEIIKIADLWPPRQAKGRKFYQSKNFQRSENQKPERNHRYLETVPEGKRFITTLFFENVSTAEMGLIIRALGLDRHPEKPETIAQVFPVKLGGAKPRCLGAVHFHPRNIYLLPNSTQGLFQALAKGGESFSVKESVCQWLQEETLLDREAWTQFQQEAKPLQEPCPRELY